MTRRRVALWVLGALLLVRAVGAAACPQERRDKASAPSPAAPPHDAARPLGAAEHPRGEQELRADLLVLEEVGRGLPREDLAACGEIMRKAQEAARSLQREARAIGCTSCAEAAVHALLCVSCSPRARLACDRLGDALR